MRLTDESQPSKLQTIEILKVEGAQYKVIHLMFDSPITATVVCIAFDKLHSLVMRFRHTILLGIIKPSTYSWLEDALHPHSDGSIFSTFLKEIYPSNAFNLPFRGGEGTRDSFGDCSISLARNN